MSRRTTEKVVDAHITTRTTTASVLTAQKDENHHHQQAATSSLTKNTTHSEHNHCTNTANPTTHSVTVNPLKKSTTSSTASSSAFKAASDTTTTATRNRSYRICDSILDAIGETPLVRLNRIGKQPRTTTTTKGPASSSSSSSSSASNDYYHSVLCDCELLVKCEYLNAGGSVKDRIGKQMIHDAEIRHCIHPGDTLIEPTSGNTGIGLALVAAVKGYNCIITMPEKMSKEKVDVLKALGAEIIRTPTEAAFDAPDSHISVAQRLQGEIPNSYILNQYTNVSNPNAHYYGTAEELLRQCGCYDTAVASRSTPNEEEEEASTMFLHNTDTAAPVIQVLPPKIDMIVIGAGTGGTISGIAKRLKEYNPKLLVIGVDPVGSILAVPESLNESHRLESYNVEGIGYDFIPQVLDRSLVDYWYKSNDTDSFIMMRRLIRDEGILCGGSSGAAVCAALHYAPKLLTKHQRCIIVLPDSVRNYMTKALSNDWMMDHGYIDYDLIQPKNYSTTWWSSKKVFEMGTIQTPLTITSDVSCRDAITLLKQEGYDMVPVLGNDGTVMGVVTEGNITKCILSARCQPETSIQDSGVIYKTFHQFTMHSTLHDIAQALDHDPFVLIITEQRCFTGMNQKKRKYSTASDDDMTNPTASTIPPPPTTTTTTTPTSTTDTQHHKAQHIITTRSVVSGIVSRIDLLDYISHGNTTTSMPVEE
jgi:cystathionine beta-synthase